MLPYPLFRIMSLSLIIIFLVCVYVLMYVYMCVHAYVWVLCGLLSPILLSTCSWGIGLTSWTQNLFRGGHPAENWFTFFLMPVDLKAGVEHCESFPHVHWNTDWCGLVQAAMLLSFPECSFPSHPERSIWQQSPCPRVLAIFQNVPWA